MKNQQNYFINERTSFWKDVNTNNNWTFELSQSGESTPTFILVCFQARNKSDSQIHDNGLFDRLPISYAVCKIGSENCPDNGINCDYDRDNYCEAYYEIENFFKQQTLTNILKPLIDLHLFRKLFIILVYLIYQNKKNI